MVIKDETIWATQKAMAQLFGVGVPAISKHLAHIFEEGELDRNVAVSKMETTTQHGAIEGKTQTNETAFYWAEYGRRLIETLAQVLSMDYSRGFSARDLRNYRQLYLCFNGLEIWYTRVPNLTWSHYRTLLSVTSDDARYWYMKEASREMWSVRTLARNVGSQYYHRLLQSPKKETVIAEMQTLTAPLQEDAREFLKDPVVAEFLQLPSNSDYTESDLERSIIKHLRAFLLCKSSRF